jgi:hypothetical protein
VVELIEAHSLLSDEFFGLLPESSRLIKFTLTLAQLHRLRHSKQPS